MNSSGTPMRLTLALILCLCNNSKTAEPKPPFKQFSSIVTIFFVFLANFRINSSSNGLTNLELTNAILSKSKIN